MKSDDGIRIHCADAFEYLRGLPNDAADLVVTSPPYEAQRKYGDKATRLTGEEWVEWATRVYLECLRVTDGVVAWVVAGRTSGYQWSATPALLMARLHACGAVLRNPLLYQRATTPGTGGPDWFASRYEWIVCATRRRGRLKWSDNVALGHPPKFPPGGALSHWTANGERVKRRAYKPPERANPGNIIECRGGGGHMGSAIAHLGQASFPEKIPEWFIRSCCPPGGTVLDPFCGTGTTVAVAVRLGRDAIGVDIEPSEVAKAKIRVDVERRKLRKAKANA